MSRLRCAIFAVICFALRHCDGAGGTVITLGAPSAPIVQQLTNQSVQVEWLALSDEDVLRTATYELFVKSGESEWVRVYAGPKQCEVISGLRANELVLVKVRAIGRCYSSSCEGMTSGFSDAIQAAVKEGPPEKMKPPTVKQIHNGTIRVTWTPPEGNSNVLTYLLERNDQQRLADNGFEGSFWVIYRGLKTTFDASNLDPNQKYLFRVKAVNSDGSGQFSDTTSMMTPPSAPGRPVSVQMFFRDSRSIAVAWQTPTDHGSPIHGFVLAVQTNSKKQFYVLCGRDVHYNCERETAHKMVNGKPKCRPTKSAKVPLAYKIGGLQPGLPYAIRIQALNRLGGSEFSPPIIFNTGPTFSSSISGFNMDAELALSRMMIGEISDVDSMTHRETISKTVQNCERIEDPQEFAVLTNQRASPFQSSLNFKEGCPDSPSAPSGAEYTDDTPSKIHTQGSLKLRWSYPPEGAHGLPINHFVIQQDGHDWGKQWVQIKNTSASDACSFGAGATQLSQCAVVIPGVHRGLQYRYRILAVNDKGESGFGPQFDAHLEGVPDRPWPPILVARSSSELVAEWVAPHNNGGGILAYNVSVAILDGTEQMQSEVVHIVHGEKMPLVHTFQGLRVAAKYEMRVQARNGVGWGNWSDPAPVWTHSGRATPPKGIMIVEVSIEEVTIRMTTEEKHLFGPAVSHTFAMSRLQPDESPLRCLKRFALVDCSETSNSSLSQPEWSCPAQLQIGVKYSIWAQAINAAGTSDWSTPAGFELEPDKPPQFPRDCALLDKQCVAKAGSHTGPAHICCMCKTLNEVPVQSDIISCKAQFDTRKCSDCNSGPGPATQQPAIQQPAIQQPAIQQPATQQPATLSPSSTRANAP